MLNHTPAVTTLLAFFEPVVMKSFLVFEAEVHLYALHNHVSNNYSADLPSVGMKSWVDFEVLAETDAVATIVAPYGIRV